MAHASTTVLRPRARAPHVITGLAAASRQYGEKYVNNPVAWAYDIARVGDIEYMGKAGLDPWQEEVFDAFGRSRRIAVAGAKGVGKDYLAALAVCCYLSTRPYSIVSCTSASARQLGHVLWVELLSAVQRSPFLRATLEWSPSSVRARGLDKHGKPLGARWQAFWNVAGTRISHETGQAGAEGGQGLHGPHVMQVFDEASGIDRVQWDARVDTLSEEDNRAFAIGNPGRSVGPFWEVFSVPSVAKHWWTRNVARSESRIVDPASTVRMIDSHGGENDAYVQSHVYGRFPTAGSDRAVFTHAEVMAAFSREVEDDPGLPIQVGIDCAAGGVDKSVAHARRGMLTLGILEMAQSDPTEIALLGLTHACRWHRRRHDDPRAIVGETVQSRFRTLAEAEAVIAGDHELTDVKAHCLFVVDDGGGYGGGPVDNLRRWGWRVTPMNNGWAPKDAVRFRSRGDELWFVDGKAAIRECRLPYSDELLHQLISREYELTGKLEQRTLERKEHMKRRGLSSPDHADAFVLAYSAIRHIDTKDFRNAFRRVRRVA